METIFVSLPCDPSIKVVPICKQCTLLVGYYTLQARSVPPWRTDDAGYFVRDGTPVVSASALRSPSVPVSTLDFLVTRPIPS